MRPRAKWGDGVAQSVERRTRDPKTAWRLIRIPPASGAQETIVRVFPSQTCCADSLSVCPTPRAYTHAQE